MTSTSGSTPGSGLPGAAATQSPRCANYRDSPLAMYFAIVRVEHWIKRVTASNSLGRIARPKSRTPKPSLARKSKDQLALENALNNLGELFRKTDRPAEALTPLLEAESIAQADGDEESVLSIAHNRALAVFASGDRTTARRLLRHVPR